MSSLPIWPWLPVAMIIAAVVVFAYHLGKTVGRDEEIKRRSKWLRSQR